MGFHVYNLRSYECANFKIYFHLWGNGGPQDMQEVRRWQPEEDQEWTQVVGKKNKNSLSYIEVAKGNSRSKILSGANAQPIGRSNQVNLSSVFNRIILILLRPIPPSQSSIGFNSLEFLCCTERRTRSPGAQFQGP